MGALMIQATASSAGKSLVVAGLCRLAVRRGLAVTPFKPQNMSSNAPACAGGGEIGRAQALQARAAGGAPRPDLNPVLIKPQSDRTSQLIVRGELYGLLQPGDYLNDRGGLLDIVMDSFNDLAATHDLVIVEGAGSPAETNLRHGDIANMGFARRAGVPVCIVGDIDRGGVIASPGRYAGGARPRRRSARGGVHRQQVPRVPEDLRAGEGTDRTDADLIILPGTKSTVSDLDVCRKQGWHHDIIAHARTGGRVFGICGGMQMLGRVVHDPHGVDGPAGTVAGLGLLDIETTMADTKIVRPATGRCAISDVPVHGYEIHNGRVIGPDLERPVLRLAHGPDGAQSLGGRIAGVHLHGLFTGDRYRRAWLSRLGGEPRRGTGV